MGTKMITSTVMSPRNTYQQKLNFFKSYRNYSMDFETNFSTLVGVMFVACMLPKKQKSDKIKILYFLKK